MTDLQALDRLIEAVEGGEADWTQGHYYLDALGYNKTADKAMQAFQGSLDAAKALHDALLPGWHLLLAHVEDRPASVVYDPAGPEWDEEEYHTAATLARAWLLATLRAYRSTLYPGALDTI